MCRFFGLGTREALEQLESEVPWGLSAAIMDLAGYEVAYHEARQHQEARGKQKPPVTPGMRYVWGIEREIGERKRLAGRRDSGREQDDGESAQREDQD